MRTVATEFTDRTFHYQQVWRQGMHAIYRQTHKKSGIARYELIRIRERPANTCPDGTQTPAREAYPAATAWGRDGWTFYTLAEAFQGFNALHKGETEERSHAN